MGDPLGMGPWKPGDAVRVKTEHRHRFNGPAAQGATLVVQGPNGTAVGLGPEFLDYAYHFELEASL